MTLGVTVIGIIGTVTANDRGAELAPPADATTRSTEPAETSGTITSTDVPAPATGWTTVAETDPNFTALVALKFVPVIVTFSPGLALSGVVPVMVGVCAAARDAAESRVRDRAIT